MIKTQMTGIPVEAQDVEYSYDTWFRIRKKTWGIKAGSKLARLQQ